MIRSTRGRHESHHASPRFWKAYAALDPDVQALADKAYALLESDPQHPAVQLKKVGRFWSARVGLAHRALAVEVEDGFLWFWIGRHDAYERLIG